MSNRRVKLHSRITDKVIICNYCLEGVEGVSLSAKLAHLQLISAGIMRGQCQGHPVSASDSRTDTVYDIYRDENVSQAVRYVILL